MFKHLTPFCTGSSASCLVFQTSGVDAGVDFGRLVVSGELFFWGGGGGGGGGRGGSIIIPYCLLIDICFIVRMNITL